MKPGHLSFHFHYPVGNWFRVCGGRCITLGRVFDLRAMAERSQ